MAKKRRVERPPRTEESESSEKLVIALDFGTTYSGVAFCFANQYDAKPAAIMDWSGHRGISVPKIPTVIAYDKQRPDVFKWGASVDAADPSIVGIKLLLDPEQGRPMYLPATNARKYIRMLPKPPVKIAADFIGAIYSHALAEISKTVPKAYMELCSKEFVLSVPAVWSDAAKNATLLAAKEAGIHPVTLIKEPEAAALHTVKALDFSIKKGDAFVVCDAGGGTVDLITYEVHQLVPNLQVKELVPGTGGMAGSLGLNRRFAQAVQNLVGDEQWFPLKKSKAWVIAQRQFDQEVKRAFRGEPDEEYFVNFPMADLEDDPKVAWCPTPGG
ncbi:Heat shock protein Hsp70 [Metarhizium album ARSEF 1941]|uniref:Heat shock protein Hsp70 n=1 Tax=Metarhizium album (strain ARSEF 1941) TaxID=1081103 RepID=A0A0B2WK01_METAS|nr:Heat shock protein Hsp70 [Metarhizium album ARSEF 1941]KHN93782.1 Heat shock protein Hsp70 [Metarhizium album ARSEF 1941]